MPPSEKMNVAGIGVRGMGGANLRNLESENIVALCDVDPNYVAGILVPNGFFQHGTLVERRFSPSGWAFSAFKTHLRARQRHAVPSTGRNSA